LPASFKREETKMPRYLVERTFPEGLSLPADPQRAQACAEVVVNNAKDGVTWVHSYVTPDRRKTYCNRYRTVLRRQKSSCRFNEVTRCAVASDHFGQFALAGLEPGEFVLTAYKPGYEMHRERISYGSPITGMTIRLRRAKGVEIRVHEAGSRKPLESVHAIEMIGDRNGSYLQLRLDENGTGYIPGALAGSTISFSAMGYVPTVVRNWSGEGLELTLRQQQRPSATR
jgi:Protein of unknown function (DUF4242)